LASCGVGEFAPSFQFICDLFLPPMYALSEQVERLLELHEKFSELMDEVNAEIKEEMKVCASN
jgi:hypothetical protein